MSGEVEPDNDIEIKKGGRPRAVIWNFFIEGPDQGDGHRSAICSACNTTWKRGKASAMERHILLDCKKVKTECWQKVIGIAKNAINKKPAIEIASNFTDLFPNGLILGV
ncbi:unnamed protein product [Rhizophagus irregularis]|nr:unnamed protein product [Rhizophagus irregularis]CAB5297534.1 unnamed protein product [Rhizophagus irregularis]